MEQREPGAPFQIDREKRREPGRTNGFPWRFAGRGRRPQWTTSLGTEEVEGERDLLESESGRTVIGPRGTPSGACLLAVSTRLDVVLYAAERRRGPDQPAAAAVHRFFFVSCQSCSGFNSS